jgi:serine protease inhibitor
MTGRHGIGAAFLIVILAAGCGPLAFPPSGSPVHPVLMNLTDSSTGFGLALADRLLAEPNAENVFISPLSATLALSMAASASHGDTRAAILTALGLDPAVDPSAQAKLTIDRLMQSDANAQLELAQAVWAQQGLVLDPAYVARLRSDYRAQLANLDFTSSGAPKVVNDWVDSATHHKITQLVDRFDPGTVAYLVNATYFHALWATEFKASTEQGSFTTFSGALVGVEMMERGHGVTNVFAPDYEAVLLPYKGGRFSMVILLPRKVLAPAEFSKFLTSATWNQVLSAFHDAVGPWLGGGTCVRKEVGTNFVIDCDGGLVMPKFTLDYTAELLPLLQKMGMPVGELTDICRGCFISRVVQKTHLEVDEKGTSAAAATGVGVTLSARIPIVVDHPFALALIDNASDAPLFLGVIGSL